MQGDENHCQAEQNESCDHRVCITPLVRMKRHLKRWAMQEICFSKLLASRYSDRKKQNRLLDGFLG